MKAIFLLFLLVASSSVQAALCVENNTLKCDELGYTESSCPNGGIACPFDISRWHCAEWTCEDGRYFSEQQPDADCVEVEYSNSKTVCYDCACKSGSIDYENCWISASVSLNNLLTDKTLCAKQGYIDTAGSCSNYLVCPSDESKIRCIGG